jgi:hypothetical protein
MLFFACILLDTVVLLLTFEALVISAISLEFPIFRNRHSWWLSVGGNIPKISIWNHLGAAITICLFQDRLGNMFPTCFKAVSNVSKPLPLINPANLTNDLKWRRETDEGKILTQPN